LILVLYRAVKLLVECGNTLLKTVDRGFVMTIILTACTFANCLTKPFNPGRIVSKMPLDRAEDLRQ